jgi:hypothetical protein
MFLFNLVHSFENLLHGMFIEVPWGFKCVEFNC